MADIAIETSAFTTLYASAARSGPFWTSTTVGYVVYIDSSGDLKYNKTSDGGASWGGAVNIVTGTIVAYDCWADWQTDGDAGTKINIAYIDIDTDDVRYVYVDTSDDSVGGDDQIVASVGAITSSGFYRNQVTISKSEAGLIGVVYRFYDTAVRSGFYTSPDGDAWTSKTTPHEGSTDVALLFPSNVDADHDFWVVFWDISANAISLKTYSIAGSSWAEVAIGNATDAIADPVSYMQMDGQIRLSDGHLILAYWNEYDAATADLQVWDIASGASITAKTNIITNEAESFTVSVFINQVNDDIYVAYCSGSVAASTIACFYQKSTDGGTNWDGETAMQADAEDDMRWVSAGCMKADWGGKSQPIWFDDDDDDVFTNTDNGVTINAAGGGSAIAAISEYYHLMGMR